MKLKQNSIIKTVRQSLFTIGIYVFCLVSSYNSEQKSMFYLLLALIPLFFLFYGLGRLLLGRVICDISKHLTDEERADSIRLTQSYAGKMGIVVAAPFAMLCALLYMLWGVTSILPYVILFCIAMVFASPFMFKHWKTMHTFMLSTEYAKQQGYNKESANK